MYLFKIINLLVFSLVFYSCSTTFDNAQNKKSNQIITTLAPTTPFESNTIDGVLATVTDQVILLSDLQHAVLVASQGQTRLLASGQLVGGSLTQNHAQQILDTLINQKVLQIKSQELGFDVPDEELTSRIQDFLSQRGFSETELEEQLTKSNKSLEEYRSEFKNELLKQQLIGRVISPMVNVSDDEVKSFYLQQTGGVKQVSAVRLRSLLIKLSENQTAQATELPIVKMLNQKIAEGENFAELVKKYSMEADANVTEGLLPPKPVSNLPSEVRERLVNLKPGQIIGPIVLGRSLFFFEYIGANFSTESDLEKNFASWKNKLQEIKFSERMVEYLKAERSKLKANIRPFEFIR